MKKWGTNKKKYNKMQKCRKCKKYKKMHKKQNNPNASKIEDTRNSTLTHLLALCACLNGPHNVS